MNKLKYIAAVVIAVVALGLSQAHADFISTLNNFNLDNTQNPGPYGTVTVSLAGNTATINFLAATGYFFVDGSSAAVELNSDSFTQVFVSESPSNNFKAFALNQHVDGWGNFDLALDQKNSAVHLTSITFTVTNNDALHPWGIADDVLAFNEQGFDAAAHLFSDSSGKTGFAAEGEGPNIVPDGGATVMLLGVALGALGMARRYLKS